MGNSLFLKEIVPAIKIEIMRILGRKEFLIEKYNRKDCTIKDQKKRFIPMFRYPNCRWTFALPIRSLYLLSVKDAKEMLFGIIDMDDAHNRIGEYRLAEIVNDPDEIQSFGRCTIPKLNRQTGEITVLINALGTIYVPEAQNGSITLYNGAPLLEGINLIVKHGSKAVDLIKSELE